MSIKVMDKVWDADLPRDEKFILLCLADFGNDEGESIYPSIDRIAWKTGYTAQRVRTILRKLRRKRIIDVALERSKLGTNEYTINIDKIPSRSAYQPPKVGRPEKKDVENKPPIKNNQRLKNENGGSKFINGGSKFTTNPLEKPLEKPLIPPDFCEGEQEYQRPIPEEEAILMDQDEYLRGVERACIESFKNSGDGIDVADYPEEVQLVLATFCKLWNFHPPHRGRNKKGGQYAKWIDWGRDLLEACGEFGVKGLEAYRQTFEQYMATHQGLAPFNVYSPGSLVNAVRGHVATLRQAGIDMAGLTSSMPQKTVGMTIGGVHYDIPVGMDGTMAVGGRIVAP